MDKLCKHLQRAKTVSMKTIEYPCRAEVKSDGVRGWLYKNKFYSRTGKEIVIPTVTENLEGCSNVMLDMEITLETGKKCERTTVTGMVNSAMKGGHNKINAHRFRFRVFDGMIVDYFERKTKQDRLAQRIHLVKAAVARNIHLGFEDTVSKDIHCFDDLKGWYEELLANGYEGLVVKDYRDYYEFGKKSKQWARFKPTKTADLKCVGTTEGVIGGNREGGIGALILVGEVEGKEVVVKAGSGMSLKHDVFKKPGEYLNKTIEVKYDSVTKDKTTGQYSLFQPRFVMIREDK